MRSKMMKGIFILAVMMVFLSLPGIHITAQNSPYLAVTDTSTGSNIDPLQPVSNLLDGDVNTYWGLTANSGEAWAEFTLAGPSLIYGLELNGILGNNTELVLEYLSDERWIPFLTGDLQNIPASGTVDLSYDRVVTTAIRIHLSGRNVEETKLSGLKIIGCDSNQIFHRIQPQAVTASENTSPTASAEFLSDGNTYTRWQIKPSWYPSLFYDSNIDCLFKNSHVFEDLAKMFIGRNCLFSKIWLNQGQVLFGLGEQKVLQNINLYLTKDVKGDFSIRIPKGTGWQEIGTIPSGQPVGWYRLNLSEKSITTSKVLVTVSGKSEVLGGISEVEFWGFGACEGDGHLPLILKSATLNQPLNYQFNLTAAQIPGSYLELVLEGQIDQPLTAELNGEPLTFLPTVSSGGLTIYSYPLPGDELREGTNFIRIRPQEQVRTLRMAQIRQRISDGSIPHGLTGLNDGFLLTPATESRQLNLPLNRQVLVEAAAVYHPNEIPLQVYAQNGWTGVPLVSSPIPGGGDFFKGPATTNELSLENPSGSHLNEIRVFGSQITDQAPTIRIVWPQDGQVVNYYDTNRELIGFIDNPEAVVKVNGTAVYQNGHYFRISLKDLQLQLWESAEITAVARDPQDRESSQRIEFVYGELPVLALEQEDTVKYTAESSATVNGTVRVKCSEVVVNGKAVPVNNYRFQTTVPLEEGYNAVKVHCSFTVYPGKKEYTTTAQREIIRCSQPLNLTIDSPLSGAYLNTGTAAVGGTVTGMTPLKVTVNGYPAAVDGMYYRVRSVLLPTEGKNTLTIKATDARGQSITKQLVLYRDTKAPVLSQLTPVNGFMTNNVTVKITGKVNDANTSWVYINDKLVGAAGGNFSSDVTFAQEGNQKVTVKAIDIAGNITVANINIMNDLTPPLAFTPVANPAGWSTNNRPIITFTTTDRISGIDHYELAVDAGSFIKVTSPYKLPVTADGEHLITVKAFDKVGWSTAGTTKVFIDTTAPVLSEFKAIPGKKKIIVSWKTADTDVKTYTLKRLPAFKNGGQKEFGPETLKYVDTEVDNSRKYTYSIQASDKVGNVNKVIQAPAVKPGVSEAVANPAVETKIEYENIVVGIPVGALSQSKTITVREMDQEQAQPLIDKTKAINVSPVYTFNAVNSQGTVDPAGVTFNKPVLVGVHFELKDAYSILKKNNLRAYYYNYKANNWEVVPESYVDGEKDMVYFFTKHFSMFSVQASVASPSSPEQIGNMGISPGKSYFQNNDVSISYGGGTAAVTAKDFTLPGRGGLDLTISRTYDSSTASGDWGLEEKNIFQAACGFINFGNPFFSFIANLVASKLDHYLSEPSGSCGFGRGWRMNFVWVEKNDDGQFVHLPGGSLKKINWTMDGSGWGGQGHGRFECHAGEHFVLEQTQEFVSNIYADDPNSAGGNTADNPKIGENWRNTGYILVTKDGTKYYMDGSGRITKIVNRLGTSEIKFYYNSSNKLDYIMDSVNRKIQFTYQGKFISSISGAGKTVNYYYNGDLQELERVVDGGIQETKYHYTREELHMGSQTVSLISIVTNLLSGPAGWVSLFLSLLPAERTDEVYYLDNVTTPFNGEYQITYSKYDGIRYGKVFTGFSIMGYEFCKATRLQEIGSAYSKDVTIHYNLTFDNDKPPTVFTCDVIEGISPFRPAGRKKTNMLFDRYSNSIDEDTSTVRQQVVTGEDGRVISSHAVEEFDTELEAPTVVADTSHGQRTVQQFKYDNWGNVVYQKNSHTKVEAYYSYANTNTQTISNGQALTSPYGSQTLDGNIHDAKTGELILNYNGNQCIPQQTGFKYNSNGNLLEKAVRSNGSWPVITKYQYDDYGNITTMTSPSGVKTNYAYSPDYGQALLTKVTLDKLTDADGRLQSNVVLKELGYEPETYRKRWEKDARGYVTEYQYDTIGREVKTVLPDDDDDPGYRPAVLSGSIEQSGSRGNNPVQQVSYYDSAKKTTVIDPLGNQTDYLYDSFEHLMEIVKFRKLLGIPYAYSRVQVSYDAQGNIASIISPEGSQNPGEVEKYTTNYQYDEINRLTKISYPKTHETDNLNPCKVYFYNDLTNETTVTDENMNFTVIKKDPVDRVIEQIAGSQSEDEVSTKYSYDSLGNKTSETIAGKITSTYVYDDLNRLTQKILPREKVLNNPDGGPEEKSPVYRYEYDVEGNLVKEVSPLGTVVTHVFDEMNREIRTETQLTAMNKVKKTVVAKTFYDLAGNKVKTVDPNGKISEFVYTARGWLVTQKDPSGGVTSFTYDKVGNKLSETDPRGNAPGAPANSYTAWYYYDDLYRVVKGVLPDGTPPVNPDSPGNNPVIAFEYDRNGNCVKETKANGQITEYVYHGRNWVLSQTQQLNGKSYETRFDYYDNGNQRYVYDNKDNKTEYLYDHLNRMLLEVYPEGNTTEYEYDILGNKHIIRDGKHNQTQFDYDNLNRLYQVTDAKNGITTNWYNEEGRLTKTVSPTGLVTKIYPNELGLPLEVVDSLGQRRTFDYDAAGNGIYKKDPRGTETRFVYDDLYRVLQQNLQNGNRTQSLSYEYDPAGNVKRSSNGQVDLVYNDADGSYVSDPFNQIQKVKQVMPDGRSYATQYQYDIMGQMTGIRYPGSKEWLNYEYDKMGRLLAIPGFAGTKNNPGFDYDENSALKMIKTDNGITTTIPDIGGRDTNGRIKNMAVTKKNGDPILSLGYDYDNANNIIRRNDNVYTYNELNRLDKAIVHGAFQDQFTKADMRVGTVNQDYAGSKEQEEDVTDQTQVKLDNSARSLIFNLQTDAENVSQIELTPAATGHRVPVEQIEVYYKQRENDFAYSKLERSAWSGVKDNRGRILIRFKPVLNAHLLKIHCNYDDLDLFQMPVDRSEFYNSPEKLVTVYQKLISRTESYQYDEMGNRKTEKILLRKEYGYTYSYYSNSNRLQSKAKDDGSVKYDYTYDENGNLTTKVVTKENAVDTWEYSYDLLNQLEQVKKNGVIVSSYIYDPNGFRVEKDGSQGRVDYVPLLNGEVGYRKEFGSSKEYSFIYTGGQHLARVNGVIGDDNAKKFYYHNDHQGSALAVTDENGNKVVERDFTPFGERINTDIYDETNRDIDEDDSGFTGKDWDQDVELYYYNARWYDPEVGRFTTEDSVADDPNLYAYCGNNPVNRVDPTGNAATDAAAKATNFGIKINYAGGITNLLGILDPNLGSAISSFQMVLGTVDGIKWASFIKKYTSMNPEQFKAYLKEKGINYQFEESNTKQTAFTNSEGQKPLAMSMFGSIIQKALIGDQKLLAFQAMEGNISEFLKNNPGLSLEQVKGLFDSSVISANNSWGFGKNEFRYEGRGSNTKGLYNAEAVVMNEGMVEGVFTAASTLPDPEYKSATIKQGIYDYKVGEHPMGNAAQLQKSIPSEDASWQTYSGKQYKALNLYFGGFNDENRNLPAENPNKVVSGGNSHAGFTSSHGTPNRTGSEGCPTLYYPDYYKYISLFNTGETGKFIIVR